MYKKFAVILGVVLLSASSVSLAEGESTVTVSATESISVVPDRATVSASFSADGDSLKLAKTLTEQNVSEFRASVEEMGLLDHLHIETIRIEPDYQYQAETQTYEEQGYIATVSVTLEEFDIERSAEVYSVLANSGAQNIYQSGYGFSDYNKVYDETLVKAQKRAKEKAEALSQAENRTLGEVVSITEGYENTAYYRTNETAKYSQEIFAASEEMMDTGAYANDPGTITIEASVTAVYSLE